jgi:hypothetical protein
MCPWELVHVLLPELTSLRTVRVRISSLTSLVVDALIRGLPNEMQAIHLSCAESDQLMVRPVPISPVACSPFSKRLRQHEHAPAFSRFGSLSMSWRPQPSRMQELQVHTGAYLEHACDVALTVPSLDYVGWHREHFVVVRHPQGSFAVCGLLGCGGVAGEACVELKELPVRRQLDCGNSVDLGSDDVMWIEQKDDYEVSGLES